MNDEQPDLPRQFERTQARRKLVLLSAALLGAATAVSAVVLFLVIRGRDPAPEVSRQSLDEAVRQWQVNGPRDYDVQVVVDGRSKDTYRVSVRDGVAVSLVHNGTLIDRPRVWDTWSVPGMFDTIRRDVETVETVESGQATKETPRLRLKCDFDPKYGYPKRYRRTQMSGGREVIWNVVEFKVLAELNGDDS